MTYHFWKRVGLMNKALPLLLLLSSPFPLSLFPMPGFLKGHFSTIDADPPQMFFEVGFKLRPRSRVSDRPICSCKYLTCNVRVSLNMIDRLYSYHEMITGVFVLCVSFSYTDIVSFTSGKGGAAQLRQLACKTRTRTRRTLAGSRAMDLHWVPVHQKTRTLTIPQRMSMHTSQISPRPRPLCLQPSQAEIIIIHPTLSRGSISTALEVPRVIPPYPM